MYIVSQICHNALQSRNLINYKSAYAVLKVGLINTLIDNKQSEGKHFCKHYYAYKQRMISVIKNIIHYLFRICHHCILIKYKKKWKQNRKYNKM